MAELAARVRLVKESLSPVTSRDHSVMIDRPIAKGAPTSDVSVASCDGPIFASTVSRQTIRRGSPK